MRRLLWALLPLLSACVGTQAPAPPATPETPVAYGRAVLDTLASPRYAGRGYDARAGAERTAAFLERRFAALGVRPKGSTGYRVPFAFTAGQVASAGLSVDGRALQLGTDFLPLVGSLPGVGEAPSRAEGQPARAAGEVLVIRLPATGTRTPLMDQIAAAQTPATRAVVVVDTTLPAYGGTRFRASVPVYAVRADAWPAGASRVRFQQQGSPEMALQGTDVVGEVRGTAVPDSFVVVTAHYDHLGCVEDAFGAPPACFWGANDNASGTAMLTTLAREIARRPLRYTVVFAAMGAEEKGLIGANALAAQPTWPLSRTRFLLNLDMMAGGRALTVFGGANHPAEFDRLKALVAQAGAPVPASREQRPNSDHWPFVERGVPAFFLITGGGTQPYHSVRDVAATLDWGGWEMAYGVALAMLRDLDGKLD